MAVFVEQKPKNHAERGSGASHSTGAGDDIADVRPSTEPAVPGADELPDIVG